MPILLSGMIATISYFTLFEGPSFLVNCTLMLMLHLVYESTAVVYDRSSLEVMDFGKTRSYGLRMCGSVMMG